MLLRKTGDGDIDTCLLLLLLLVITADIGGVVRGVVGDVVGAVVVVVVVTMGGIKRRVLLHSRRDHARFRLEA